jgi:CRISPR-associated protein (TIGR02584 family)
MSRVLVVTVGETPQVVTETVYALLTDWHWVPDEIVLATTSRGETLFNDGDGGRGLAPLLGTAGRLSAMYASLGMADRHVDPRIEPVKLPSGVVLDDVRSEQQVAAFADTLLKVIAAATADPVVELHLSLAGGRKTMSHIAGAVLSIFGRPKHVLSHVLIEPETFERAPAFWWPGQPELVPIRNPDGTAGRDLDATAARVRLHAVPFIRLRAFLSEDDIFRGDMSFATAVERANEALSIDRLVLDLEACELRLGRYRLSLDPKEMALMAMIADAARNGGAIATIGQGPDRGAEMRGYERSFPATWQKCLGGLQSRHLLAIDPDDFAGACNKAAREAGRLPFNDALGVPAARIRAKLRTFPPDLAQRVLLPRRYATAFTDIDLLGPPELLEVFNDEA